MITVRLATGSRFTVPNIPLNLSLKFLHFASTERSLVLDLDPRYDRILNMDWLERHVLLIDWTSKILGVTRNVSSEVLIVMNPPSLGNKITIGASL